MKEHHDQSDLAQSCVGHWAQGCRMDSPQAWAFNFLRSIDVGDHKRINSITRADGSVVDGTALYSVISNAASKNGFQIMTKRCALTGDRIVWMVSKIDLNLPYQDPNKIVG